MSASPSIPIRVRNASRPGIEGLSTRIQIRDTASEELGMECDVPNLASGEAVDCYLGVDPGLNRTGYAILQRTDGGPILREGGVIRSSAKLSLAQRVLEIGQGMREVVEEFQPQMMAIEQVFSFGRNPKTAILMAHARGAILMVAAERKIPIVHYTPTQIKRMLTGSGKASKEQIQFAIKNEFRLEEILEPNDVADAAAVALCLYHSVRFAA